MKIPDIVPVTDLRQDAAAVLKKLQGSAGPLVVTQRGRAIAVLQSIDAYEKSEHERDLLHLLATGEKFPESGRSIPEFPDLPHREVIVRPYRFFYRVSGKTIWVVAVWHGAQLPEGPRH
jgi:prevent-host-death family protein